jgi:lysophospholipase L1-like esterase
LKKSSWLLLAAGILVITAAIASELVSSRQGLGPYQISILGIGLLLLLMALNRHEGLRNGLTILLSIVFSLCLVEFILTILPQSELAEIEDPLLGVRPLQADKTDALGWRNDSVPDDVDFVAIGDSLTWGVHASSPTETWSGVLAELTGMVDYRMAYVGYGSPQYAALTEEALSLHPKTIIIGFYFGNDILDAARYTYELDAYADLRLPEIDSIVGNQGIRESHLKDYSNDNLTRLINGYIDARPETPFTPFIMDTNIGRLLLGDAQRSRLELEAMRSIALERPDIVLPYEQGDYLTFLTVGRRLGVQDMNDPLIAEGLRITKLNFQSIHATTTAAGINLLVVGLPSKEFIYADFFPEHDAIYEQMIAAETQMRSLIYSFLDEQGIAYVDTLPCLVAGAEEGQALFEASFDGHPSALGYRVIGECVADGWER